jgi:hypothetical protein
MPKISKKVSKKMAHDEPNKFNRVVVIGLGDNIGMLIPFYLYCIVCPFYYASIVLITMGKYFVELTSFVF